MTIVLTCLMIALAAVFATVATTIWGTIISVNYFGANYEKAGPAFAVAGLVATGAIIGFTAFASGAIIAASVWIIAVSAISVLGWWLWVSSAK